MSGHILNFVADYVPFAIIVIGGSIVLYLALIKACELFLLGNMPLACL